MGNKQTKKDLTTFLNVAPNHGFSMANLPYGVFRTTGEAWHIGVAIGDMILDLNRLTDRGFFPPETFSNVFLERTLNPFLGLGKERWDEARDRIQQLLGVGEGNLSDSPEIAGKTLVHQRDAEMALPVEIGDYTDFYASEEHARNVGSLFRGPVNAIRPNWYHLPVGYHGRASSVVVSGTDVLRPAGQYVSKGSETPRFGPTAKLDFELEAGWVIGTGNALGRPVSVENATEHIFGMVLVNDWSARDIQQWEYVPLGPFLGKSFQTSISAWVVPMQALEPFLCAARDQNPTPLPYLRQTAGYCHDISLEAALQITGMDHPEIITRSNVKHLYWTPAQMIAHHTSNGCNLRPGDLLASGTISAPGPQGRASLLEHTENGEIPIAMGNESRTFLEDGDRVVLSGKATNGEITVGFGPVSGRVLSGR